MQRIKALYRQLRGTSPVEITTINGSGSNRQYLRLLGEDGTSLIGVVGTSKEENEAFIYLAGHFAAKGIRVPEVIAVSEDRLCYLQQDLGRRSLFDALRSGRERGGHYDDLQCRLLRNVIAQLPRLQVVGAEALDFGRCYPQAEMDVTNVLFDLNYFKYCFLKPSSTDFHELRLEKDFKLFADDLTRPTALPPTFLYRDFQARNIMLDADDNAWFIDFQGGRRGDVCYDLASFLWQASARYPSALREELTDAYLDALRDVLASSGTVGTPLPPAIDEALRPEPFRRRLRQFVLFRLLQVLGAYGYRGYFERKQHFLDSIAPALASLRQLLDEHPDVCPYPTLRDVLLRLTTPPGLHVRVFSFSYKRGIPADESGNGGGYVFDCRATNNPGRYPQYASLTGRDAEVIRFLEDDGEILRFLDSIYPLADFHVRRYIDRGFTDLMFAFGCTGGQHRSVYCAQHLAEYLHERFGIRVTLCHREQGITEELK